MMKETNTTKSHIQLMIFSCFDGVRNLPVLNLATAKTSELWMVYTLCRSDRHSKLLSQLRGRRRENPDPILVFKGFAKVWVKINKNPV